MKQKLLFSLIALCLSIGAWADNLNVNKTFTADGVTYKVTSITPNEVQVGKGNSQYAAIKKSTTGALTIPASVTGSDGNSYSVTSIGDYAFYGCKGLTSITIPNSVTFIGIYAFAYCSGLTSITIPNSVTSIGNSTFFGCSGLTSVTIPNSVTSIGNGAFSGCSGLTSITTPNSVTFIGIYAFAYCSGLTSIPIPNSVTGIAECTFYKCSGLTSITIPNSVTSIGINAFRDCSGLTSVTIPNSVTSIGDLAFGGCSGLTSIIIENGNTVYDSRGNCNAIITTANNELIAGCINTVIPNSVTSIKEYAFYGCSGLTSITIPNSVTYIGIYAFSYCSGLTSVTIPNSVTSIGFGDFEGCSGLISVAIPNSVTSIEGCAFRGCSGLTSVTIPNSVTRIGDLAFSNCSGLTSIVVEGGNTVYDSRDNCNAIIKTTTNELIVGCKNSVIPASVTSIGFAAFEDCSSLTSITIPNSVTSIGNEAFAGCSGLTEVRSMIEEPFAINDNVFSKYDIPLYVPAGTMALYEATNGWKEFSPNIVEMEVEDTETVTIGDALVAGFSSNKNLDFTSLEEQGVSAWIATGFRGGNVLLSRVYAVSAGEGVYVKAEKAGTYVIPTTTEAPFYMNMFVGVPDGKTVDMYEDFWGETYLTLSLAKSMSTGKPAFYPNTAPKTYGKNKMYLHMPARLLPEYATTRLNEFSLGIEFEDETTGISEASPLNDKGQMINEKRGGVYDLQGRKLDSVGAGPVPARLHKGLYIVNGKKVVIK